MVPMHNHRGFTLLEALISIAVMGLVLASSFKMVVERSGDIKDQQVAMEAKQVLDAARPWIRDNFSTVQATATATIPHVLSVATLVASGYLPSSFSGVNAYGQTYQIKTLEPVANNLESLIVTFGGTPIDRKRSPAIAALVGVSGGYIPYSGDAGNCNTTSVACGAFGGWRISNTANYWAAGTPNPGGGHLALFISAEQGLLQDDFVYRDAIPGQPQLNQMSTPLIMASTQVKGSACTTTGAIAQDGAGAVVSCQAGVWSAQGGAFWKDPVDTFAALTTSPCNATTAWETRVVKAPSVGAGPRAYSCDGSAWQPLAVGDDGAMTVSATMTVGKLQINDVVTRGAACTPNGLVARDSVGLLSCQSGIWAQAGGGPNTRIASYTYTAYRWPTPSVSCNANEVVIGGGGACTGGGGHNFIYRSNPIGNGWGIGCDTPLNQNVTGTAYAVCAEK